MNMRKSGSWMVVWDDRLLEYCREEGSVTPAAFCESEYIHVSPSNISRRLGKLADHGLLEPLENGVHIITEEGELYLEEKYNADTGEKIEPA